MPTEAGTTWTIVVAAGSGSRFGGDTPKQFLEIAGKRVLDWSVSAAASVSDGVVVVVPKGSSVTVPAAGLRCQVVCVNGGDSRSESVRKGLAQVPDTAQVVLVHDAARGLCGTQGDGRCGRAQWRRCSDSCRWCGRHHSGS